ncbi:MAG: DNA gyrase inhibitor YacG [Phycisphaeraceae bacterium]
MAEDQHETGRDPGNGDDGKPPALCPICGRELGPEADEPFCSQRCRNIDLGNWLDENYTISRPIEQADLEEDD